MLHTPHCWKYHVVAQMTIAVDWDVKPQGKQIEYHYILTSLSSGTQAEIVASDDTHSEASGTYGLGF